ncbi:MAG TPA: hypothetical protein PKL82_07075 [Anaerolineaceae bacterium]|nr:hypothetical protein [Anaerolineaceae bacterium]HOA22237.1 hypothetical protein [Anaerolineaceae bacterium]HOG77977.1 hypothetical protein [Anaerolineaceae bacterium]
MDSSIYSIGISLRISNRRGGFFAGDSHTDIQTPALGIRAISFRVD